jgi:hypothetical protein
MDLTEFLDVTGDILPVDDVNKANLNRAMKAQLEETGTPP